MPQIQIIHAHLVQLLVEKAYQCMLVIPQVELALKAQVEHLTHKQLVNPPVQLHLNMLVIQQHILAPNNHQDRIALFQLVNLHVQHPQQNMLVIHHPIPVLNHHQDPMTLNQLAQTFVQPQEQNMLVIHHPTLVQHHHRDHMILQQLVQLPVKLQQ